MYKLDVFRFFVDQSGAVAKIRFAKRLYSRWKETPICRMVLNLVFVPPKSIFEFCKFVIDKIRIHVPDIKSGKSIEHIKQVLCGLL